mmetsp:Transcript_31138/g.79948  ORF Transcript_31138/g.79948 Transcript_31138/m.79948 type:complete len:157 (-) Transcript_31138:172-642(-)|eukprot:jgi/Tetstr1/438589/TSEL_027140.t1
MQTTLVDVAGKGSNPKTTLYVGGLEESVNEATLHAAFVPFGEVKDVNIPLDHAAGTHRGFGFVEFLDKDDAAAAIDNMHNAELFGRVLRVNYAQPMKIKGGEKGWSHQAVWADTDSWLDRQAQEAEVKEMLKQPTKEAPAAAKNPMEELEESGAGQ